MGDANARRPVATRFEHGVDFGLLVHKSAFMVDKREPLVLSNCIFELLEVNPGAAGSLIQLHTEDVDAVVESVTAHAEKGAGTKTTLYVGQQEEEVELEEEEEDVGGVGAGGRKEKPNDPLMISVQKVRVRPGKGKGKSDGWFPQPITHNTRQVCTDDPENKLPMYSLCCGSVRGMGSPLPTLFRGTLAVHRSAVPQGPAAAFEGGSAAGASFIG